MDTEAFDAAATDAAAREQFDAAFAAEARDEAWASATEAAIEAILATTDGALRLVDLRCQSTLCRIRVDGDRDALPTSAHFAGVAWWLAEQGGHSTLLLVRDGAEIPLPPPAA